MVRSAPPSEREVGFTVAWVRDAGLLPHEQQRRRLSNYADAIADGFGVLKTGVLHTVWWRNQTRVGLLARDSAAGGHTDPRLSARAAAFAPRVRARPLGVRAQLDAAARARAETPRPARARGEQ